MTGVIILVTLGLVAEFLIAYCWFTRDTSYGPRKHRDYRRTKIILASLAGVLMLAEISAARS